VNFEETPFGFYAGCNSHSAEYATLAFLDREVPDPDLSLTGVVWNIDTFIEGRAASNFPLQAPPTVSFDADGSVEIFTTCDMGAGEYIQQGQELSLSGSVYTEEGCGTSGSAAANAHVQQVLTDGTLALEIEANRLTLMRGDIGLSATAD